MVKKHNPLLKGNQNAFKSIFNNKCASLEPFFFWLEGGGFSDSLRVTEPEVRVKWFHFGYSEASFDLCCCLM